MPVREAIACLAENLVAVEERVKLLEDRIGAADSNFKLIANKLHTATMTARALMPHTVRALCPNTSPVVFHTGLSAFNGVFGKPVS